MQGWQGGVEEAQGGGECGFEGGGVVCEEGGREGPVEQVGEGDEGV